MHRIAIAMVLLMGCTLERLPARDAAGDGAAGEISRVDDVAQDLADVVQVDLPDTQDVASQVDDGAPDPADVVHPADVAADTPPSCSASMCPAMTCMTFSAHAYCCTPVDSHACGSFCDIPNVCTVTSAGAYYCCTPL